MPEEAVIRGDMRLFFLEGDGDPECHVTYEGFAIVTRPTASFGDITNHYAPDPLNRRRYKVIAKTSGAETPPEMPISNIYSHSLSKWLRLGKQKCDHGIQAHLGACSDPQDYNSGYYKILCLEKARIRSWGLDGNLGSLQPNDEGTVNEEVPFAGEVLYEIKPFDSFARLGSTTITRPLVDGVIADSVSCGGDCGTASDGCSIMLAVSSATVGSPGLSATVYFTDDGGSTVQETTVSTLGVSEDPTAIGFDGTYVFVLSPDSESHHYAALADILAASDSWVEVTIGYHSGNGPVAAYVAGPRDIFICGVGGYVYKATNITSSVSIIESANATTEDLNDIAGADDNHVVAVGNNNAVIATTDGETFTLITGPAAGVALNRVWVVSNTKWLVAAANGRLYFTKNGGNTWAESGFGGSGSGSVHDITFATVDVGFMSHTTSGNVGNLYKTIDGGASWVVLPEQPGGPSVPSHRAIVRLLPCDQNTFYAVGTNSAGTGGMLIKAL